MAKQSRKKGKPAGGYGVLADLWTLGNIGRSYPESRFVVNPWRGELAWPHFPEVMTTGYALFEGYVPQDAWVTEYHEILWRALRRARSVTFRLGFLIGAMVEPGALLQQLQQVDRYQGESDDARAMRAALSLAKRFMLAQEHDDKFQAALWTVFAGLHPGWLFSRVKDPSGARGLGREAVWAQQAAILQALGGEGGLALAFMPWARGMKSEAFQTVLGIVAGVPETMLEGAGPVTLANMADQSPSFAWERNTYGIPATGMGSLLDDISKIGRKTVNAVTSIVTDPAGVPEAVWKESRRVVGGALEETGRGLLNVDKTFGGGIAGAIAMQTLIALSGGVLVAAFGQSLPLLEPATLLARYFPGSTAVLLKEAGEAVKRGENPFDIDLLLAHVYTDAALLSGEIAVASVVLGAAISAGAVTTVTAAQVAAGAAVTGAGVQAIGAAAGSEIDRRNADLLGNSGGGALPPAPVKKRGGAAVLLGVGVGLMLLSR